MMAEAGLQESEVDSVASVEHGDFMSAVLDCTTDGILLADVSGTIVYVNQPLLELFGYEAGELVGRSLETLLPESQRTAHRASVEAYVASPTPRPMGRPDLDIEGRHAGGSNIPIDVQLKAVPGTAFVSATVRDMTAQRRVAAELALGKIDLANLRSETERLRESLDLVIQRLFALGMSIAAGASSETVLADRMTTALHGIDEIIETVQRGRR